MPRYNFKVPGTRGFRGKDPLPDPDPIVANTNDMIMHAMFARLATGNGETVEFETKYDQAANTVELDIPDQYLDMIEKIEVGPNMSRYLCWLTSKCAGGGGGVNAPNLSSISFIQLGVDGKLSFGPSNVIPGYVNVPGLDVNDLYSIAITDKGIFDATVDMTGILADNVVAHIYAYPANSFGNGDNGTLQLLVNSSVIHSVNLSTFGSGGSFNANGSGFTLSAATPAHDPSGDPIPTLKYRTGSWKIASVDQYAGHNFIQVKHVAAVATHPSQVYNFVVDESTAVTSYSTEALSGLAMIGLKQLSGVKYHTSGTANYGVLIHNAYHDTYAPDDAITHPSLVNCSVASQAIPPCTTETDDVTISKAATVIGGRVLNQGLTIRTRTERTVQSVITSSGVSAYRLLMDNVAVASTNSSEPCDDEGFRMYPGAAILTNTSYSSGPGGSPYTWDSTESLVGAGADHNTGLLIENSSLKYPTSGINGGNYAGISDGPAGNVNYSSALGIRTYYRYFYTAIPVSNFRFNVACTGTVFVPVTTGPSGNNLTFEVLAPNTTTDGLNIIWKDAVVAYIDDFNVGCYAATFGNNRPTNWGMSLGAKNTSTSGNVIIVRMTASATWTGSISSMAVTWL